MGRQQPAVALGAVRISLILLGLLAPSQAVVRAVLDGNSSTVDFADMPALFGAPLAPGGAEAQENEATPCWEVGLISKSTLSMKQCYFPHKRAYLL